MIEWKKESEIHYGIIDCNFYEDRNPILEEIIVRNITYIDFIIVSHLHYDHYSGFAELLEYCSFNEIKIGFFLHTFNTEYFRIFSYILLSQKQKITTQKFLTVLTNAVNSGIIIEIDNVTNNFSQINLCGSINLSFLAPIGNDYLAFSQTQAKFIAGKKTTIPDFNYLSTIIHISDSQESLHLTSDGTIKAFKRILVKLKSDTDFIGELRFVQVPHHGSIKNLYYPFWRALNKKLNCKALFSVGEVKRDKLPNREVVEFFDLEGYYNESTNYVHGLPEYYGAVTHTNQRAINITIALSAFSVGKKNRTKTSPQFSRFSGDKVNDFF